MESVVKKIPVLLLAAMLAGSLGSPGQAAEALRVCADPDNLPFSSSDPSEPGLYVELADLMAARMALRAEYTWWLTHYGRRAVRNTLLADRCDAYFGLPNDKGFMGRSLILSRPFLDVGDAIIAPPSVAFSALADLKTARLAVQFASSPQLLLASHGGFQVVTFRMAQEALDALAAGDVDAAFVWGPTAGYYNKKKLGGAYRVVPVAGEGLQWEVAIGVRKDREDLRTSIDRALAALQPDIHRLAEKYGFPLAPAMDLKSRADAAGGSRLVASDSPRPVSFEPPRPRAQAPTQPAAQDQLRLVAQAPAATTPTNPFQGNAEVIPAGRSQFNQHCAHCHSPNAMSPEPSRDLRRLRLRYGERMVEVAYATVTSGAQARGMPPWKEVLGEETIWKIITFLESVQTQP
jgi:polar amino acid transport system substrate-binding protein